ncbi:MAG: hypothetical protein NDP24_06625 [Crenarchaeota archaeon]|nr:hypothetical protein [Thermoproteota archaeon]
MVSEKEKVEKVKVNLFIEREIYEALWKIVKARYVSPSRKLTVVVNEALREYVERHREELARSHGL